MIGHAAREVTPCLDGWTYSSPCGATLIGCAIGLNRELHHKATGMRTLGLVALGSALAVLGVAQDSQVDVSRVIQGVITGIGFLGAGVILHPPTGGKVHGLTTGATIWVTASLGILVGCACRRGYSGSSCRHADRGGPIEKWCHRWLGADEQPARGRHSWPEARVMASRPRTQRASGPAIPDADSSRSSTSGTKFDADTP